MSNLDDLTGSGALGPVLARATGDDRWLEHRAHLIAGGKSNLTFELRSGAGSLVLRRPPTGDLLPGAHNMVREARVQRALAATNVPVAHIVAGSDDPGADVLGLPYYVMEMVDGVVPRDVRPDGFADTERERISAADALVDGLAALHLVDPDSVGLGDFGRPTAFMPRQIGTWRRQWDASKTHDVPAFEHLADRLARHDWSEPSRPAIVHGDYRLDNCVFDRRDAGRIAAVLDWELSTLGDPLADVGMLLFYWIESGDMEPILTPALSAQGFPGRDHLLQRYATATGADVCEMTYFVAFAHLKFAAIAQGVAARVASGQMAGQDFGNLDEEVERIAQAGLAALDLRS